jgi:hypothetical protein
MMCNRILTRFAVPVLLAATALGCSLTGELPDDPSTRDLLSTPTTISLGGEELRLRTYLWRDFMPISPPDGKPLIGIFRVYSVAGEPIPTGVEFERAWLVNGTERWDAKFSDENPPQGEPADELSGVARNGPFWEPGIDVVAIVRIRDATGSTYLLRAIGQTIERTD